MTSHIIQVEVFDLVVFGGTGDLARRKLLPALFYRERDDQLPPDSRIVGISRATLSREAYAALVEAALREHLPAEHIDAAQLERFLGRLHHVRLDVTGERGWQELTALLERRRGPGAGVLSRHRAAACSARSAAALGEPGSRRRRRASCWRSRSAATSRQRRAINDAVGAVFAEERDLPHRPLSRQGDGAEPVGAALRQHRCSSRCGTRATIDHVQITVAETDRRRRPRPTTTTAPARCATWCRTTCCSCCAWWRWSRRRAGCRRGARREAEGAARAAADRCRATPRSKTVRGQYSAGVVNGGAVPGYAEELGAAPPRTETFVAHQGRDRQLALGRRAVLSAHRQAPAARALRDRRRSSSRCRTRSSPRDAGRCGRTVW